MRSARFDYHVHETYSSDARDSFVEEYIKVAEQRGIEEIAFTTHEIITGPYAYFGVQLEEVEAYIDNIHRLDETTDVKLLVGLEVDYFGDAKRRIEALVDEYPFDFILGSTHFIGDYDIGSRNDTPLFFGGRDLKEATSEYFRFWKEAVESGLFDSMAHPDYWRRFLFLVRSDPVLLSDYGLIDEAIDSLVSYDVGIEVNSGGRRHEHGIQYPIREFLVKAHDAGLKKITMGSDSHIPDTLGYWLDEAVDMLMDIGYTHISSFESRKHKANPIESVVRTVKNQ